MIKKNKSIHSGLLVDVVSSCKKIPVSILFIRTVLRQTLLNEGIRNARVNLFLVSDPAIKKLNRRFLLKNSFTDVLSFDLRLGKKASDQLAADIVISVDRARSMAKDLNISFQEEICRYVIHGVLHLTGYDDTSTALKDRMWKRQEYLLMKVMKRQKSINVSKD